MMPLLMMALQVAPVVPPQPESEGEVWALTERVGTREAFRAYLLRFPRGEHQRDAARRGLGMDALPPAPPAFQPDAQDQACTDRLRALGWPPQDSPERSAYDVARRSNRVADWQAFVTRFPASPCRVRVERIVARRSARLPAVPGWGPLLAQRRAPMAIFPDDYPPAALRAMAQGRVAVDWDVAEDGEAENCRVIRSSGNAELDDATCRLTRRLSYDPARNARGEVARGTDRQAVTWLIPSDEPSTPATQSGTSSLAAPNRRSPK